MSSRTPWAVALLFACVAAGTGVWGYQQYRSKGDFDFQQRRVALLEEENTRLHALVTTQEKTSADNYAADQRKSIEEAVTNIRGLKFNHQVVYDVVTRAGIKKVLEDKLSAQYSDQDFKNYAAGLAAFGLVDPDYPLKQEYISLLGEQIAAFYDQHQHKLFMFEDAKLDDIQNRIVLAHELTHALQDQNFGLLKMPLETRVNDDLALATSALVEGDATLVMNDYSLQNFQLRDLHKTVANALSQNMKQFQAAPRILRDSLTFPYIRGLEFCGALRDSGGYEAVSAAFQHPPTSTSQILHPQKYFAHEEPIPVEWPDTSAGSYKAIDDNVLGEFGTRILLSQWLDEKTGIEAADGWRGDRYLVFDNGNGLVWKTLWTDAEHAERFRTALASYVAARFKQSTIDTANPALEPFSSPSSTGEIITAKTGNGIIFIWGSTKELNDALVQKFSE